MHENFNADDNMLLEALEMANVGIAIIDSAGNFRYTNGKFGVMHGHNSQELIGTSYTDLFRAEEKSVTLANLANLFLTQNNVSGERKLERKDGGVIDISYATNMIGQGNYVLVTVNDITEIKHKERLLSQNEMERRLKIENSAAKNEEVRKLIMNAALDAIICIDKDNNVTLWNLQAEKIFGWSKEEVLGKKLTEIIVPVIHRERHIAGMKRYLETGVGAALNVLMELTAINRQGHEFPIELTILPIKQEFEEEIFCAFIRDITARKKNESVLHELNLKMSKNIEDLAKSNVELERFAYIASHDLQEPLRMVTNFLTQLEKKYDDKLDETGKQYLNFAVEGAVRMRKIILDLLEYSRVGKVDTNVEQVDLAELIADILKLNQAIIEDKKVVVKTGAFPIVTANRTSIQQVFQNLIGNALKYHKEDGIPIIEIGFRETADHWEFSVSDNGIGIDSSFFEKIFIIFQRLHNKEEYSGTGIGLAICKKIVESHGGTIWVVSEATKGSTFYFTIKK